jgi:hypothetical protein
VEHPMGNSVPATLTDRVRSVRGTSTLTLSATAGLNWVDVHCLLGVADYGYRVDSHRQHSRQKRLMVGHIRPTGDKNGD